MTLHVLAEAEAELTAAIAYYEAIEAGLGGRLKEEVRWTLAWIGQNPRLARCDPTVIGG